MKKRTIVKENFWRVGLDNDRNLYRDQLGWSELSEQDAQSDYPETVFRYYTEIVGFNILFYWVKDGNFYTIETEKTPIEVRRIYPNPTWDGRCEFTKANSDDGPSTCSAGEIIATFDDPTQVWDGLKIDGVAIGDVLEESAIIDLD
jgi:hypothetical protein